MFHQGDRKPGTTGYELMAVKAKGAKAMPQVRLN